MFLCVCCAVGVLFILFVVQIVDTKLFITRKGNYWNHYYPVVFPLLRILCCLDNPLLVCDYDIIGIAPVGRHKALGVHGCFCLFWGVFLLLRILCFLANLLLVWDDYIIGIARP